MIRLLQAAHEARALASSRSGDQRRARSAMTAAARLGRTSAAHQHNVAVLDALQGRWAAALRVFARLGSAPPEARVGLALGHAQRGEQGRALRLLEQAQKLGLDTPWLRDRVALLKALLQRCPTGGAP